MKPRGRSLVESGLWLAACGLWLKIPASISLINHFKNLFHLFSQLVRRRNKIVAHHTKNQRLFTFRYQKSAQAMVVAQRSGFTVNIRWFGIVPVLYQRLEAPHQK